MVIALEGLSCAGKTTLLNNLCKINNNIRFVPEFVLEVPKKIDTEFCMENDVAKSQEAVRLSSKGVVIQDRSFISTIVYSSTQDTALHNRVKDYYQSSLKEGTLQLPDLIIYLSVRPEEAIARAKKIGWYSQKYAWYTHTVQLSEEYEKQLKHHESLVKVIRVDAEQKPAEILNKVIGLFK